MWIELENAPAVTVTQKGTQPNHHAEAQNPAPPTQTLSICGC